MSTVTVAQVCQFNSIGNNENLQCSKQLLMMSIFVDLNSFIRKRITISKYSELVTSAVEAGILSTS